MRQYSKISPTIWRSKKFRKLESDDARLAYFYLITCPHSNSAGCFDLPLVYGGADLGWQTERFGKAIDRLSSVGLIRFDGDENTVLIENWAKFNPPTNAKHALGLISELEAASSDDLKSVASQCFSDLLAEKSFKGDIDILRNIDRKLKAMAKPIDSLSPLDRDKTITDTRLHGTETETRENRAADCAAATPDGAARPPLGLKKTSDELKALEARLAGSRK